MARTFEKLKRKRKEGIEMNIREVVCEDGQVSSAICIVV
jgi:hypothetical protein